MRTFLLAVLIATPLAAGDASFEQVLVPFDTQIVPGVKTIWTAELHVRNDGDQPVNLFPETCLFLGRPYPCFERIEVPARTTILLDVIKPDYATPTGVMLYVPKTRIDDVAFSLRVRAVSSAIGTEIPVVRERNYRTGRTTLLNVPLGAGSRAALRLYTPNVLPVQQFRIRVVRELDDVEILSRVVNGFLPTDPPVPAVVPAMFDGSSVLSDAALQNPGAVRVVIEAIFPEGTRYWPLITITDNATQQVTAITPQ